MADWVTCSLQGARSMRRCWSLSWWMHLHRLWNREVHYSIHKSHIIPPGTCSELLEKGLWLYKTSLVTRPKLHYRAHKSHPTEVVGVVAMPGRCWGRVCTSSLAILAEIFRSFPQFLCKRDGIFHGSWSFPSKSFVIYNSPVHWLS
jgi:hypothetical protein